MYCLENEKASTEEAKIFSTHISIWQLLQVYNNNFNNPTKNDKTANLATIYGATLHAQHVSWMISLNSTLGAGCIVRPILQMRFRN